MRRKGICPCMAWVAAVALFLGGACTGSNGAADVPSTPDLPAPGDVEGSDLPAPGDVEGSDLRAPGDVDGSDLPGPSDVPGADLPAPSEVEGSDLPGPGDVPGADLPGPGDVVGSDLPAPSDVPGADSSEPCGECEAPLVCKEGQCVAVECWDGNDVAWDGCNEGKIAEFKINQFWVGAQAHPAVATRADGSFAVAWQGNGEADNHGISLRFYDAQGDSKTPEVPVNTTTFGDQEHPGIAALSGGDVVVVWNGFGEEDDHGIYMRRFGGDGEALGGQEAVNTFMQKAQEGASVTALDGGGFVVAWASLGKVMFNHEICARIYAADGTPVSDEILVNLVQDNDQQSPVVTGVAGGGFAAAWTSKPQDGSDYGIFARQFDGGGIALGDDVQINSYVQGLQWTPWMVSLAGGDFAVAWDGEGAHDDWGVSGRVVDEALKPVSEEFGINTITAADQYGPRMAALVDGRFVVAWESFTEAYVDPDAEGDVFQRVYNADGSPATSADKPINTWKYDGQGDPSVAPFEDGGWIVVWYSFAQDGDERGIFGQRFDSSGAKIPL